MRPLILAAAAALSACAAANTPESCRITHVADIPIQKVGNFPLVDVGINGQVARLLLDTGAEATVIRDTSFDRLGLERDYHSYSSTTGIGAQASAWQSRPAVLTLGSVKLPAGALSVATIPVQLPRGGRLDGLLGSQVLSAYDLDVDMMAGRLGLYERRRCPDGAPPFPGASQTLRAEGNRSYKMTVPIMLDGAALTAMVDTGATRTLVDAETAGLGEADMAADRTMHMNGADPVGLNGRFHRFKQLRVGSDTVENPLVAVSSFKRAGYTALLGTDFWRDRRVWISYGSRTVTVGPVQPRPR